MGPTSLRSRRANGVLSNTCPYEPGWEPGLGPRTSIATSSAAANSVKVLISKAFRQSAGRQWRVCTIDTSDNARLGPPLLSSRQREAPRSASAAASTIPPSSMSIRSIACSNASSNGIPGSGEARVRRS